MSETHANAFKLELQEKEALLAGLQGEIEALRAKAKELEPSEELETPENGPGLPAKEQESAEGEDTAKPAKKRVKRVKVEEETE